MKTRTLVDVSASLGAVLVVIVTSIAAENRRPATSPPSPDSELRSSVPSPSTALPIEKENNLPNATEPIPRASLEKLSDRERQEAKRRHIQPVADEFRISIPPPPVRAETKPSQPAPDHVWKPGHWAAVKGEWQWKAGEWGLPPTPSSVWIEGKYDEKEKRWSPGYWQPDRVQPAESEPPAKVPAGKF